MQAAVPRSKPFRSCDWIHVRLVHLDDSYAVCRPQGCCREHGFEPFRRVVQHCGEDVAVGVEGEADLAVAQELHDDAGRDVGGKEVSGGAVAEIVRAMR